MIDQFLLYLKPFLLFLMTEDCFEEIFIDYNITDVGCLKAIISKCLGIGIILGSILVKVPQIVKILRAGSAKGLSFVSITLEIAAAVSAFSYNFVNEYPFSSYGDSAFLAAQTALIGALVLHYGGAAAKGAAYLCGVAGLTAALCTAAPLSLLWALQAANIPMVFSAKMLQAYSNHIAESTGQMSGVTVFMLLAGSLARIFTSVQETGDAVIVATYLVSSAANAVLFGQLLYYWDADNTKKTQ